MSGGVEQAPGDKSHWLLERRIRVYPRIFLAMFLLTGPLYASTFDNGVDKMGRPPGTDFIAFWSAGRLALDGRVASAWNLDELAAFQHSVYPGLSGPTQWAYPPTTLPLVVPFGALPHLTAYVLWVAVGVTLFFVSLAPLLRGRRHAWALALAFPGVWLGIPSGQVQFFVAALMGGALVLLPRRPVLAGVLVGLMVIKPQLAVVLPLVLVAGREWRAFASAAATAVVAVVGSALTFGVSSFESWWASLGVLGDAIDDGSAPVFKFVTPYMSLRLLGVAATPALFVHAMLAVVAAVVVWRVWTRSDDPRLRGASAVVGTFLVTPYAADYDLAVLAFPIAWMGTIGLTKGWLRGDRNLLVLMWTLPVLAAPVALFIHLSIVPVVMALLLRQLYVRAGQVTPTVGNDQTFGWT